MRILVALLWRRIDLQVRFGGEERTQLRAEEWEDGSLDAWPAGPPNLLMAVVLAVTTSARAAGEDPRRTYAPLRDDENWAFLRDPSQQADIFDPLKYIRLVPDNDGIYLTLGGEIREYYEFYRNELWGLIPGNNGYLLQRYMLHADLHLGPAVRLFLQLKSSFENGRNGGPRALDVDHLDFNQAYIDLIAVPAPTLDLPPRALLRVGRQEMNYGAGRLIAVRESPNVRRAFDGVRAIVRSGRLRLDLFWVRETQTNPGVFDDGTDGSQTLFGAYGTWDLGFAQSTLDTYYLGIYRKHAVYRQGSGPEWRHTTGARLVSAPGQSWFELEAAIQFGRFREAPILAWIVAGSVQQTFPTLPLSPSVTLGGGVTSGDLDPNDPSVQTFTPLFPRGFYFGVIAAKGAANNVTVHPRLSLQLPLRFSAVAEVWWFWRESTADGVYGISGLPIPLQTSITSAYLGDQLELDLSWEATRHLSVNIALARFWAGTYIRAAGGTNTSYAAAWLAFKF